MERKRDEPFLAAICKIADAVTRPAADDVDRRARFPAETMSELREVKALSACVPTYLGGLGVGIEDIALACQELGKRCGAAGLIFAMHQIQILTLLRHAAEAEWFRDYLERTVAQQLLIGSVTSETGTGGDLGRSVAAATPQPDGMVTFEKSAPTVSYGLYADELLISLRRDPDANGNDQVMVIASKGQLALTETSKWDSLGMRGTCSPAYTVSGRVPREQILPQSFSLIARETMVPISHVLWTHVWLGIAIDAFERAREYVRVQAKKSRGQLSWHGQQLSRLRGELSLMHAAVKSGLTQFIDCSSDETGQSFSTMATSLRFNNLKVSVSDQAVRVCHGALSICGILGYVNNTPFSVGRQLRDSLSAPLMIANDRIHETNANILLIAKDIW